jgi:drug/metabolite transporter (DMT)-like permease
MKRILPKLAIIFAAILWSFDGLLRQALYSVPSMIIVTIEHIIGAILFIPFILKARKEIKRINQQTWVSVFWISVCGGILGTFFYTSALSYVNYINLSVVVLLQKLQPLFAISLASVILKEKLSKKFLLLASIAIIGSFLVTFGLQPLSKWEDKMIIASLFALLAAFSWGSSTVLGKYALQKLSFQIVTSLRLIITSVICIVIIMGTEDLSIIADLTRSQWFSMFIISISTGSIALFIYYYGLKFIPASHATLYELFWPLSAMFIDWFFRSRTLESAQIVGAVLLLSSIILLTRDNND